ncbi:MAG: haloacid dehalogenase type II [Candidatus Limnocylindrales bacterium]
MTIRLSDFDALSFDCYGTLIDWEQGIWAATAEWRTRTGVSIERDALLEAHGALESAAEAANPSMRYPDILGLVMAGLGQRFGSPATADESTRFGASVPDWPAFPDSVDALRRLGERYRLIILSNVDRDSFVASNARLGVTFDAILTAQDIGSYKPDPRNFVALLAGASTLGVREGSLLHVAQSLYHDHVPAKSAGLATVWIDRRHDSAGPGATPEPPTFVSPDLIFESMAAFADACEADPAT